MTSRSKKEALRELKKIPGVGPSIALDLWDGSRVFLPTVSDAAGLVAALQTVAEARAIPVQGAPMTEEVIEDEEGDPADE